MQVILAFTSGQGGKGQGSELEFKAPHAVQDYGIISRLKGVIRWLGLRRRRRRRRFRSPRNCGLCVLAAKNISRRAIGPAYARSAVIMVA